MPIAGVVPGLQLMEHAKDRTNVLDSLRN